MPERPLRKEINPQSIINDLDTTERVIVHPPPQRRTRRRERLTLPRGIEPPDIGNSNSNDVTNSIDDNVPVTTMRTSERYSPILSASMGVGSITPTPMVVGNIRRSIRGSSASEEQSGGRRRSSSGGRGGQEGLGGDVERGVGRNAGESSSRSDQGRESNGVGIIADGGGGQEGGASVSNTSIENLSAESMEQSRSDQATRSDQPST